MLIEKSSMKHYTSSMIKYIAGMNLYGDIIKRIDKRNKTAVCPTYGEKEYWDHVLMCEQNKNKRDE